MFDPKLTNKGRNQAKKVSGHFDVVLCSTLTRAKETLELSNVSYDHAVFSDLVREFRTAKCDFFEHEVELEQETEEELAWRIKKVMEHIASLLCTSPSCRILIVGHRMFFKYMMDKHNCMREGPILGNAKMTKLSLALQQMTI